MDYCYSLMTELWVEHSLKPHVSRKSSIFIQLIRTHKNRLYLSCINASYEFQPSIIAFLCTQYEVRQILTICKTVPTTLMRVSDVLEVSLLYINIFILYIYRLNAKFCILRKALIQYYSIRFLNFIISCNRAVDSNLSSPHWFSANLET